MSLPESELEDYLMNNSFYSNDKSKPLQKSTVKTSFMKTSPSIKALESILNERSKSFTYNLSNISEQSVSSFQTAPELVNSHIDTSRLDVKDKRLDTIDASPLSHNDSTVHENEHDDKGEERVTDNEDTLIDDASNHTNSQSNKAPKYVKMPSVIPSEMRDETRRRSSMLLDETFQKHEPPSFLKSMSASASTPNLSSPNLPPPNLASTPNLNNSPGGTFSFNESNAKSMSKSTSTPKTNNFGTFENYQTPKSTASRATASPRKSPHFRSNSAFNLNFKNKETVESPNKHKRSSTMTDLANLAEDKKSKFSFKSLFKKKDKKDKKQEDISKKETKKESKKDTKKEIKKETKKDTKKDLKKEDAKKSRKEIKKDSSKPIQQRQSSLPLSLSPNTPTPQPFSEFQMSRPPKSFKSNTNINFIREVTDYEPEAEYNDDYEANSLVNNPATKLRGSGQFGEELTLDPSPIAENFGADQANKRQSVVGPSEFSTGLQPSALPKSNNPFTSFKPHETTYDVHPYSNPNPNIIYDDDDIFGSPKGNINEHHIGDSLFPKSLNPQEVESIVSLERSRSMKSVKSSKRTSFVNYDGSDENIILFNESFNSMNYSPSVSTTRSNSILKNKGQPRNRDSIDSKLVGTRQSVISGNNDEDFNDLMEFSDFINFDLDLKDPIDLNFDIDLSNNDSNDNDNLNNDNEKEQEQENTGRFEQQNQTNEKKLEELKSSPESSKVKHNLRIQVPNYQSPSASQRQSVYETNTSASPVEARSNRMSFYPGTNESPIVIPSSPSIDEDLEEPIQPLNIGPKVHLSPEITVTQQKIENSNLEIPKVQETGKSPILNDTTNANGLRPISMSFKGLKAPSFGDKIANKNLRTSGSHQSFNISYEDSDFSESAVGGGFGTSDEEEDDDELEDEHSESEFDDIDNDQYYNDYYDKREDYKENYIPQQTKLPKTMSSLTSTPISTYKSSQEGVRFSSRIILYETYDGDEYDRHPDTATCNQLTPALAQFIRDELNELKSSMAVHENSRCYTHFY